jgi:hypothetical protein
MTGLIDTLKTRRVTSLKRNRKVPVRILHVAWTACLGCVVAVALCVSHAHAEEAGVKANAKRAGQTVGATAREVGTEAKTAAPGVWQSMKNAGSSIAAGAKKVGAEIKPTAKKVGTEIGTGAKKAGAAAKEAGGKVKDTVAGDKKAG